MTQSPSSELHSGAAPRYRTVGYVGSADLRDLSTEDLLKLTHINIAFGHVQSDRIVTEHLQNMDEIQRLKSEHPQVKILLSVGGWSAGGFSEAASTEAGRAAMAKSSLDVLSAYGLDGIDLDWEYPCYAEAGIAASPDDRDNFTLLLRAIREALDGQGAQDGVHYLLTIAAGADQYYIDGTRMDEAQQYLDYVQLMTYDMRGGFQILTGHHTNLYTPTGDLFRISTQASARLFEQAGVPREKLVIGAAFYSRMWKGVPNVNDGLYQMAGGSGGYGPEFTELHESYIDRNGYARYWDDEAKAPYLYDGGEHDGGTFITYDDEESIAHKCKYVQSEGLGGVMFWEYRCDRTGLLLEAIRQGLLSSTAGHE
ncbi:glycoside hydrolase family 18 protein [Saccharibacillus sp. CPCC 101409]|uniref:glycoside hydrolase family 18 protein n=1 Tax=Saccharibacillus sp. CPCC 101409 TaxID=3058041 RepID=UPI002672B216|nr:glycoside hydrolase family 18 protein [Saccharibacillus sp. CPCC 101409]MDO3411736.1 glycoside hydrolase family 18 protein [Saccharibacillus sp. CPCC 101409]